MLVESVWRVSQRRASMRHVDTTTTPLTLHPFTIADAERLLSGEVDPHDGWEGGYAFTDEPELLRDFVRTVRESGDPAPFGPYLVRRANDGATIGGINLFGPPDADGVVEFALARSSGATVVRAEAEIANLPARRTLENAGLMEIHRTADSVTYEIRF
jgi:hypothetical protein